MTPKNPQSFEQGLSAYRRCLFSKAEKYLLDAKKQAVKGGDLEKSAEILNMLLRIYIEKLDEPGTGNVLKELTELIQKEKISRTTYYYNLGIIAAYRGASPYESIAFFEKSLNEARIDPSKDHQSNIVKALYGLAAAYYNLKDFSKALKLLDESESSLKGINNKEINDLLGVTLILRGLIYTKEKKFEKAIETFWKAHSALQADRNWRIYGYALLGIGNVFMAMELYGESKIYLELLINSINPIDFKRLHNMAESSLNELNKHLKKEEDLVIFKDQRLVKEKRLGEVKFKNKFVLFKLLSLLADKSPKIMTKEEITQTLWHQNYNPLVHDTRVYTAIKRLRQMIEPDSKNPKYILSDQDGYFINTTNNQVLLRNLKEAQ